MEVIEKIIGVAVLFFVGAAWGFVLGHHIAMNKALDRGYAVQCVGKSGIYWECE